MTANHSLLAASVGVARRPVVLALGPHVDDLEIGCGATLLLLKRYYDAQVHVRVFTSHYTQPVTLDREKEGEFAARLMSYDSFEYFTFEDTRFPDSWAQVQRCVAALKLEYEPTLVLAPNISDTHQDHVVVAQAVSREFRHGENVWSYEISQFGVEPRFAPNLYVDVGLPSRSTNAEYLKWLEMSAEIPDLFSSGDTLAHEKIWVLREAMTTQSHKPLLQPHVLFSIMTLRAKQASASMLFAEAFRTRSVLYTA